MQVSGIDHVNILTDDLDATARFYEDALGLRRADNPALGSGLRGSWMHDATGHASIHLVDRASGPERYAGYVPGKPTNAVHHVALRCTGFEQTRERLTALGIEHKVNDLQHLGLRQIFLVDPNAVNLELNFAGD